jgi:transposase-like protein
MAMYLISCHKKGISSVQLATDINVSQKSAWHILQKTRTLFQQDDSVALEGEVECDEMYLGGRETNKHQSRRTERTQGRSTKTKTPIFGMVERFGNARVMKVSDTKASTLRPIIEQFVAYGSHIFTDEYQAYNGLNGKYTHSVIQHGVKEYSKDGITTNSVEGFWAHFKRMVFGTYHFVSTKYLQRYIDEAVYRWNTQVNDEGERFTTMLSNAIGLCTYEQVKMVA